MYAETICARFYRNKWADVERDVVVLHQFPRSSRTPSMSPFTTKLETYLRITKIPYQVINLVMIYHSFF